MTLLDRYYGRRLAATLVKAIAALVFIFILIDLLTHRRGQIMRYDIPWTIVFSYYLAYIPQILYTYQIGALSMLVVTLLVLGEAAQNNEITAAFAGGISLRRLIRGPLVVAVVFAIILFVAQDILGAPANRKAREIESRYFSRAQQNSRKGISWPSLEGGWTCHIMKFNKTALTGEDVFLHSNRPESVQQILAKRIYWDDETRRWMIEDGRWLMLDPKNDWQGPVNRITLQPAPIQETPEDLFALDEPPETKPFAALARDIERAQARGIPVSGPLAELHAKIAQPVLGIVMLLLAVPFAMRLRRGGLAIGFGVGTAIALAYLLAFRLSMALGAADRLPPIAAAWLANILFFSLAVIMFRRTQT
ncbi:MAG TPA: LptF/LptG family permease [Candidatus Hydrogenedentes bacterium]|nr:LptF/LptG family permease [Candidatus Hydrogenedentota bacterium]HOV75532.1 LptF/LptG family permease [Candidatus Hydrogenedentota bacterium]HPC18022.1 LptF/LptG family permease [Candidatus Hydrogenedentota bacterium]HRT21969.1 LptF/LptG family permease [Candidatus Hydrogenedentota bacterium]HRT66673.1 LptF/LptG family permease [Candidatus Hydrogenedentota bacterium]